MTLEKRADVSDLEPIKPQWDQEDKMKGAKIKTFTTSNIFMTFRKRYYMYL